MGDVAKDLAMWEQDVRVAHELTSGHEIATFRENVIDGFRHGCVEIGGWLAA